MKKAFIFILMVTISLSLSARGGCVGGGGHSFSSGSHSSFSSHSSGGSFRSSSHSYSPSSSSSHASYGTRSIGSSTHINSSRGMSHVSAPVRTMSASRVAYYRSSPSYRYSGGSYYPVYHCSPNYLFWYFIYVNQRTHKREVIKANSKKELDQKVKSCQSQW